MRTCLQDGEGGLAAQDILVGRASARDADGADDRDAVEDDETAGRGHQAPLMRDDETLQPGLARTASSQAASRAPQSTTE